MAHGVEFDGVNAILKAPPGDEENCRSLSVFCNGVTCVSCWQLSEDELREVIVSGGKVFLSVFSGETQPPVFVGSEQSTRDVNADYGVWKR